jgi:hypothetical protein
MSPDRLGDARNAMSNVTPLLRPRNRVLKLESMSSRHAQSEFPPARMQSA